MKESLYNYLIKCSVAKLPAEKQLFYQYVMDLEYIYEEQSETPDQYFDMLVKNHPYQQAADHFHISTEAARNLMNEIERDIRWMAEEKMKQAAWLDYTSFVSGTHETNKQYFLTF